MMNMTACLAPQGAPGVDIVVTDSEGDSMCTIQVKSRRGAELGSWTMGKKSESLSNDRLVYCFVRFGESVQRPDVYIVPSNVVAQYAKISHQVWLVTPGLNGAMHNDNSIRKFDLKPAKYLNAYQLGWADKFKENWGPILGLVSS
jgi:hypothetical protein